LKEREEAINILNSDKLPPALRSSYAKAGTDPTTKLHSASVMGDSPLHLPQLLDQYKYPMVSMPADRISKQILPKLTEKSGAGSRSLTVQQLWLIVPGNGNPHSIMTSLLSCDHLLIWTGTILTYFPPKEPNNDGTNVAQVGDVENAILNCVADIRHPSDVCLDVYDLAALITHTTTTNLLGRTKHPDFQFINLYRAAVGELVSSFSPATKPTLKLRRREGSISLRSRLSKTKISKRRSMTSNKIQKRRITSCPSLSRRMR
jgi:hypothetical protein